MAPLVTAVVAIIVLLLLRAQMCSMAGEFWVDLGGSNPKREWLGR